MRTPRVFLHDLIVDTVKRRTIYDLGCVIVGYNSSTQRPILDRIRRLKTQILFPMEDQEAYHLVKSVINTAKVAGDIAEVGCFNGGSTRLIGENKRDKYLHVFDTFEGLPPIQQVDGDAYHEGLFSASLESVQAFMRGVGSVRYYKGLFPSTSGPVADKTFSLVHLDVDLYQATHDGLEFFYPRMNKGGIIISHDYNGFAPGVKKAFDDFFADKPEPLVELPGSQVMIVKCY